MDSYVLTLSGDPEIHNISFGCHPLPLEQNWEPLGEFSSPEEALVAARQRRSSAQPCYWCCPLYGHASGNRQPQALSRGRH